MMAQRHADNSPPGKQSIVRRVEAALAKMFKPADTYHPEQYYLRGRPGPKAQAKASKDHDK